MGEEKLFCKGGGCTAKLGAGILSRILERIPRGAEDPDLLIGYDSHDDAAVYRLTDDLAFVQTLDFFPPLVEDPYTFGQIAATNALSDIYAMGGEVKTALNIVCFPETMDLNILGEIMRGGAEKVIEAGGVLAGGTLHRRRQCEIRPLGHRRGESQESLRQRQAPDRRCSHFDQAPGRGDHPLRQPGGGGVEEAVNAAIQSMTTLNKTAAALCRDYHVHAVTDVTGFGFLGHLHEMLHGAHSAEIFASQVSVVPRGLAPRRRVFAHRRRAAQPELCGRTCPFRRRALRHGGGALRSPDLRRTAHRLARSGGTGAIRSAEDRRLVGGYRRPGESAGRDGNSGKTIRRKRV